MAGDDGDIRSHGKGRRQVSGGRSRRGRAGRGQAGGAGNRQLPTDARETTDGQLSAILRIHALAHGGEGVGRGPQAGVDEKVWFIAGALPGEVVHAKSLQVHRRFIRGALEQVVAPASTRVDPPCPRAATCGGCNWQHVDPRHSAELKRGIVADQLRRFDNGEAQIDVHPAICATGLGYRRRARMHYHKRADGQLILGFRRRGASSIVDLPSCPVLVPELVAAMNRVRTLASDLPGSGSVVGLTDGTRSVIGLPGVELDGGLPAACEALVDNDLLGIELRSADTRVEIGQTRLEIDGGEEWPPVRAGAFSFAQANAQVNHALVEHVQEVASPAGQRILEAYAGSGNFTRALAAAGTAKGHLVAVESVPEAVDNLRQIAGVGSIDVRMGNAERLLPQLADQSSRPMFDVTVVDPPRRGLGKSVAHAIARLTRLRIVYISCDPATLARDIALLCGRGFHLRRATVFDLMPMTSAIETVAVLERGSV